jgi:hypothetical protein
MKPTIVKHWDLRDRGDGVEIRVTFKDNSTRKLNFRDAEVGVLARELEKIWVTDDRPVTEGEHVR